MFNWKKHYDVAVTLCNQAIAALAAREAGVPQIEALLHQAKLLMEEPAPAADIRPRHKKIEKALLQAEEMASKFIQAAVPRDLPPQMTLPVSLLLGRTRLALAELRLEQARARDQHAVADREKVRPAFPRAGGDAAVEANAHHADHAAPAKKGKKPAAPPPPPVASPPKPKGRRGSKTGAPVASASGVDPAVNLNVDDTVIIDFIDEMDEAEPVSGRISSLRLYSDSTSVSCNSALPPLLPTGIPPEPASRRYGPHDG